MCAFAGEIFKFYILICDQKFYIAVNNAEYCTYDYRMPAESIRTVQLKYDLQFVTQVDHRSIFPTPHPPVQFDDARNIFSNDVPQPFKSGKYLLERVYDSALKEKLKRQKISFRFFRSCYGNNGNTIW